MHSPESQEMLVAYASSSHYEDIQRRRIIPNRVADTVCYMVNPFALSKESVISCI